MINREGEVSVAITEELEAVVAMLKDPDFGYNQGILDRTPDIGDAVVAIERGDHRRTRSPRPGN